VTTLPTIDLERELLLTGKSCVIGLDEVGKGAWAGPLVIGAAVLTREVIDAPNAPELMGGARDSKQLSETKREACSIMLPPRAKPGRLVRRRMKNAIAWE